MTRRQLDKTTRAAGRLLATSLDVKPAWSHSAFVTADADLIAPYVTALRASREAPSSAERAAAEKRAASHWFCMSGETQAAAQVAAAEAGLLEARVTRDGLKLYPVVRDHRVVWVSIPERE